MAQHFQKYALHLESGQDNTLDRKRVGDPPGYQPSVARDAVRLRTYTPALTFERCMRVYNVFVWHGNDLRFMMIALVLSCGPTLCANGPLTWQVSTSVSSTKEQEILEAKQSALYGRAQGVFKNVGFMCFMMWMSGSQIHLFSIMMTVSGIYQPLMAIMNSRQSALVCLQSHVVQCHSCCKLSAPVSNHNDKAGHRLGLCRQHDCQTPCQLEPATCLQDILHHFKTVQC